jgi:type II secretory pathway component PulJ
MVDQRETGTVLVETLVAVLIVSAMAGLWFETLGQGARQQRALADRRLAMLIAQSQMATVGVLRSVGAGATTGSDAGMDWRTEIRPYPEAGTGIDKVSVAVGRPGAAALVVLQSLRLEA